MKIKKIAIASLLALPIANPAFAQLEEIVVTAQKRSQTLQDTPIAVTVTSADTIEKAQIQDLLDLQSVVPSLRVSTLQTARNATFSIRGFGNGANNPGVEPSVGVFIDGVYRSRSAAAISDLPRLERVEVLSGPQSTLFGKNASAGVISVATPTPSGESGGYLSGSFGDFNAVVLKGLYEGAINDDLSFDIGGSYNSRDGYFENLALNEELNERNRFGLRGQLYWTPNDSTSVRIIADYDEIDEACCGVVNLVSGPATPLINALGGELVPNDPDALEGFFDDPAINEISNGGISLQADFDRDTYTITSITSFRNSEAFDNQDIDFSSADLTNGNLNDISIDTFTTELRFASNGDGAVDWLVGGFYFDESIEQDTNVLFGPAFRPFIQAGVNAGIAPTGLPLGLVNLNFIEGLVGAPQGSFFANNTGTLESSQLDNESFSIFGQVDWRINDSLTATLGLNYTDDEKDFSIIQTQTEVRNTITLPTLALAPGVFLPLNDIIPVLTPNTISIPNAVESNETSDDELTYTARLAWDVNDNLNIYGTYATGFKASSVNLGRDSAPLAGDFAALQAAGLADPNSNVGTRFALPEEAAVIELGIKTRFERGSLNVAIFDQKLENFQSNVFNGTGFELTNAEEQSVVGAEIDFKYFPSDAFQFGISATILDPEFDSFTQSSVGDLTGQQPAGISELSLSLNAQYDFTLAGNEAFIRGDYQYEDEVQTNDNVSAEISSREVSLLNLSAGIVTENGFGVTVWGRNVTDDEFIQSAFPSVAQAGSFSGYRNEPRTYGVTLRKDF